MRARIGDGPVAWIGTSAPVARWRSRDGRSVVVKRAEAGAVAAEAARLGWLAGRGPTPSLVDHVVSGGVGWLVTTVLDGSPATAGEHHFDVVTTALAVGRALRRFHDDVPVTGCPFARPATARIEAAEANAGAGTIDPERMDTAYRRVPVERLLDELRRQPPDEPEADLVVTHGAPTLSHLLLGAAGEPGWVSPGRLGVADRHSDLATAARDLARVVGPAALPPFYDGYGIDAPDPGRIDWYVLADQLS